MLHCRPRPLHEDLAIGSKLLWLNTLLQLLQSLLLVQVLRVAALHALFLILRVTTLRPLLLAVLERLLLRRIAAASLHGLSVCCRP